MAEDDNGRGWWKPLWGIIDGGLEAATKKAKRTITVLRMVRILAALTVLLILASGAVAVIWPEYLPYVFAFATVYLAVPLVAVFFIVGLPLKAKSIVRLVDKGYPANVKELAIRVAARKLHEQSIESEELLVETAINESRKAYRKYKARAERLKQELDAAVEADGKGADDEQE